MAPDRTAWTQALTLGVHLQLIAREAAEEAIRHIQEDPLAPASTDDIARWAGVPRETVDDLLRIARAGRADEPTAALGAKTVQALAETLIRGLPTLSEDGHPSLPGGPTDRTTTQTRVAKQTTVWRTGVPRRLGPYQLLDELGHGGMGIVYRARHEKLGTLCAVKILVGAQHATEESRARFRREAAGVARMGKHANIVAVHDLGEDAGIAYYAMELVDGTSLRERLRSKPFTFDEAARLMQKVCSAVHFAHQHGIVHRDIKPENILVRTDGEPQVMDFGLAQDVSSDQKLSVSGQVMGTLAYMAPEQARGDVKGTDLRADVYTLGGVLYDLLTGSPPHPTGVPALAIRAILQGSIVPPRRLRAEVPRDLETIAMKCLSLEPRARYASAAAVAEDLARWLAREPVQARPLGFPGRVVRAIRRRPLIASLVAAITLLGCGLAWRVVGPARILLCTVPDHASVTSSDTLWLRETTPPPLTRTAASRPGDPSDRTSLQDVLPDEPEGPRMRTFWIWPPGTTSLLVGASGFQSKGVSVSASGGTDAQLGTVRLEPAPKTLLVDSEPQNAEVWIDGSLMEKRTPLRWPSISSGRHHVEVRLAGYETWQSDPVIEGGGGATTVRLGSIHLVRTKGTLSLVGDPPGMTVVVRDAKTLAEVARLSPPVVRLPFDIGTYRLDASAPGRYEVRQQVDIVPGGDAAMDLRLGRQTLWEVRTNGERYAAPLLVDLDSDGFDDCVAAGDVGTVIAFAGTDGDILWRVASSGSVRASPVGVDLDRDGVTDCVVATREGRVFALSGRDGELLWTHDAGAAVESALALADLDGDGVSDVLFGTEDGHVQAVSGDDGRLLWDARVGSAVRGGPAAADLDGDGPAEVLVGTADGRVLCLDGRDGRVAWTFSTGYAVLTTPAIGDLDGDGTLDCVVGSNDHSAYALSGRDGALLWKRSTDRPVRSSPVLVDLDGDGTLECLLGSQDRTVRALEGRDGRSRWLWQAGAEVACRPEVCDGEGGRDAVVVAWDGTLTVLSGLDGKASWTKFVGPVRWGSPVVADLMGDGTADVVLGLADGRIVAFPLPAGMQPLARGPLSAMTRARDRRDWASLVARAEEVAKSSSDAWTRAMAWRYVGRGHVGRAEWQAARSAFAEARRLGLRAPDAAVEEWAATWLDPGCPAEARRDSEIALAAALDRHPDVAFDAVVDLQGCLPGGALAGLDAVLRRACERKPPRAAAVLLLTLYGGSAVEPGLLSLTTRQLQEALGEGRGSAARWHGYLALLARATGDERAREIERRAFAEIRHRPRSLDTLLREE